MPEPNTATNGVDDLVAHATGKPVADPPPSTNSEPGKDVSLSPSAGVSPEPSQVPQNQEPSPAPADEPVSVDSVFESGKGLLAQIESLLPLVPPQTSQPEPQQPQTQQTPASTAAPSDKGVEFTIDEKVLENMLDDPKAFAQAIFDQAVRASKAQGQETVTQPVVSEPVMTPQQQEAAIQNYFYGRYPDLLAHSETVGQVYSRLETQYPQLAPIQLMQVTAQMIRSELSARTTTHTTKQITQGLNQGEGTQQVVHTPQPQAPDPLAELVAHAEKGRPRFFG